LTALLKDPAAVDALAFLRPASGTHGVVRLLLTSAASHWYSGTCASAKWWLIT
jgi:hypothetical protein